MTPPPIWKIGYFLAQFFLAFIQERQLMDSEIMNINPDMNPHTDTLTHSPAV